MPGQGAGGAGVAQLKLEVAHLSKEVKRISDALETKGGHSRLQEEMLAQLKGSLGAVNKEVASSQQKLEERLAQLSDQAVASAAFSEDIQARLKALQEGFSSSQKQALDAQFEESRKALAKEAEHTVHAQLRALHEREAAQAAKANREMHELRAQMEFFLSVESSATAKCLSCFNSRSQMGNQTVQGADGKIYQQRSGSPPLGGLGPGGDKLPSVQLRGQFKTGTKLMGGAGASLHAIRTHGVLRMEEVGGKSPARAASVGALPTAERGVQLSVEPA